MSEQISPVRHRRARLRELTRQPTTHAGLWLDKYLADGADKDVRRQLVREVAAISDPELYTPFYRRWQAALAAQGAITAEAEVRGRMVVGLGAESVLETAVTLHRTYGVPLIPGSALKGLAAAFARQRLGELWAVRQVDDQIIVGEAYKTAFGTTEAAGYLTFFDALPVPGSWALYPDVLTIHHPEYYGQTPASLTLDPGVVPADWDNPNPVPLLSATGHYRIALAGPADWVQAGFRILRLALAAEGIGAKTSSGYGRLDLALPAA